MKSNKEFNKLQLFGEAEDNVVDILREINEDYDHLSAEVQLEVAKLAQLKRIADNLESINCNLINIGGSVELLEKVSDCISENPYGSFLCITGNVSADAR